uniref:RNA polymerase sigma factor sigC n=1 Tax=Rhizophora mucronata TaxID=61149 RepID=A0A2P2LAK7_RHIMU
MSSLMCCLMITSSGLSMDISGVNSKYLALKLSPIFWSIEPTTLSHLLAD